MADEKNNVATSAPEGESQAKREAALLFPPFGPTHKNDDLHGTIRLLLLCSNPVEREIVTLHTYHRLPLSDVARRVGVTEQRAAELMESLASRLRAAGQANYRTQRIARMDASNKPQRKAKQHG